MPREVKKHTQQAPSETSETEALRVIIDGLAKAGDIFIPKGIINSVEDAKPIDNPSIEKPLKRQHKK